MVPSLSVLHLSCAVRAEDLPCAPVQPPFHSSPAKLREAVTSRSLCCPADLPPAPWPPSMDT